MFERRKTRQVVVGRPPGPSVAVGGDAPISIQFSVPMDPKSAAAALTVTIDAQL